MNPLNAEPSAHHKIPASHLHFEIIAHPFPQRFEGLADVACARMLDRFAKIGIKLAAVFDQLFGGCAMFLHQSERSPCRHGRDLFFITDKGELQALCFMPLISNDPCLPVICVS